MFSLEDAHKELEKSSVLLQVKTYNSQYIYFEFLSLFCWFLHTLASKFIYFLVTS